MDRSTSIHQLKAVMRTWLMTEGFKHETQFRNEIADAFGAPFIYKQTVFSGTGNIGLSLQLAKEKWEEFEPHYVELQALKRNYLLTENHINNYLNQCKTCADCMALLPKEIEDKFNKEVTVILASNVTLTPAMVKQYQQHELFQELIDRILILGDI